jgi:hypothetical protein
VPPSFPPFDGYPNGAYEADNRGMTEQTATQAAQIDFGVYRLAGDRLAANGRGWIVNNATAYFAAGQSDKGPDVGRAILGILGGAALGAAFGFLIVGGVIAMVVFALVIGLVAGLKPVEHGNAWVTIDLADGSRTVIEGPLTQWQQAQRMTDAINALRGAVERS